MRIRPEIASDATRIDTVVTEAFKTAAHASGTEAQIVRLLRADGALQLSLVAEEDGVIRGYVAVSAARIGDAAGWSLFGPLAVSPERQRQGIGSALMTEALARLRGAARGAVLVGDPTYYRRFGFRVWPGLFLPGVPDYATLALPLEPGVEPAGELFLHPAFALDMP